MKSGFVAILGRPNAGKSTLLNSLIGERIAIVTPKPQTTRNRITGIVTLKKEGKRPAAQIIFVDTPGVHKTADKLTKRMMQEVDDALSSCEIVLLIHDVADKSAKDVATVLELARKQDKPCLLLLNKIDLVAKNDLLPMIAEWQEKYDFAEIIPISAYKKQGLDELLSALVARLSEGPQFFDEDEITDQPMRFIAAELVREALLLETQQEVPYATAVQIEKYEELPKLTRVAAAIFCERAGQKAIIVGKQGSMIKAIGTRARKSIERLTGTKVFLELFVKVKADWRESDTFVEQTLDWRKQIEGLGVKTKKED